MLYLNYKGKTTPIPQS